ncbi:sugar phosphate isomerase/epimerase family protein [uncultured Ilumatobacter sp.]|uniref:sugar phosphate isomerase/epimerase family protein n=1 Tax=Ilumatobacter sp. TaxID=1967498 RepID=UPI002A256BC2|nr:sugar phosphate isomerase/epimerase [Ilumatobacter sp.]
MTDFLTRLAGAPISWGVCEVPGWGLELQPRRVLGEMQQLGLTATELGSDGYLPTDPAELKDLCAEFGLEMIGGFVPLVLHEAAELDATIEAARRTAELMSAAGATVFVTSAVTDWDWGPRTALTSDDWNFTAKTLSIVDDILGEFGMTQAIHPHLRTVVETRADIEALLDVSDVGWTFDMGHMQIGGMDPLEFIDIAFDRIRHVHLKDVVMDLAGPVFAGDQSIMDGVQAGMFCNLGRGDVPIGAIVTELEARGYDQWYVLEQDAAITAGEPAVGAGPLLDVLASIEFLKGIEAPASADEEIHT